MKTSMMLVIGICIVIILIITSVLFFIFNKCKISWSLEEEKEVFSIQRGKTVPKIIWTYWDNNKLPDIPRLCQANWRKFAPNYDIKLIHKNTVHKYINLPKDWEKLPKYRQADIIRLKLLAIYGGIWVDASIFLLDNPDNFIGPDITLFIAPNSTVKNPVYENWFISSPPGHPVLKQWYKETIQALSEQKKYVHSSPKNNVTAVNNIYDVNYLICHLVLKNIYERDKLLFRAGKYIDSTTTAYSEHNKLGWKNLEHLVKNHDLNPKKMLIKLRKPDRDGVDIKEIPDNLVEKIPDETVFCNAYIINLDRLPERYDWSMKTLGNIGINAKKWSAIDAQSPEFKKYYEELEDKHTHAEENKVRDIKVGEIACYLSHRTLWEKLYNDRVNYALIFEDDIDIPKHIDKKVILEHMRNSPGFDLLSLGHCYAKVLNKGKTVSTGYNSCSHAYIVSRLGLKKLLSVPKNPNTIVDLLTRNMCRDGELLCYLSNMTHGRKPTCDCEGIIFQNKDFGTHIQ